MHYFQIRCASKNFNSIIEKILSNDENIRRIFFEPLTLLQFEVLVNALQNNTNVFEVELRIKKFNTQKMEEEAQP
jgi:hypothetical protein